MKMVLALVGLVVLSVLSWRLLQRDEAPRASAGPHESRGSSRRDEGERVGDRAESTLASEAEATIVALRQELQQKDQLLQRVLLRTAATAPEPRADSAEEERDRALESAATTLNQRMFDAAPDDAVTVRLETALEEVIRRLPDGVQTEFVCASTMCRLVLRGGADAVGAATNQVVEDAPKLFAGTMVLPTADGESTMYVARDPGTLDLSTPSAGL